MHDYVTQNHREIYTLSLPGQGDNIYKWSQQLAVREENEQFSTMLALVTGREILHNSWATFFGNHFVSGDSLHEIIANPMPF